MTTEDNQKPKLPSRPTQKQDDERSSSANRADGSIAISLTTQEVWAGPLPHPNTLSAYNDVVPNGAERLMRQFELESEHRREMQSKKQDAQIFDLRTGKLLAFVFLALIVGLMFFAVERGHAWLSGLLGTPVIISVVWGFLRVTGDGNPEGEKKDDRKPRSARRRQ